MRKSLFCLIVFMFLFCVAGFAEKGKSSDPVLSASFGKSIIGRTLPPGTYRVVPELKTGQREATIRVTFDDAKKAPATQPVKPEVTQPLPQNKPTVSQTKPAVPFPKPIDGPDAEPDITDIPQTKPQNKQKQNTKPEEPTGIGPEYDCEYGLPRRDGTNCAIQLTPSDLPAGYRLDDFANMNKACEVHQWVMHGADRKDRIEVNISAWNQRAESYYNWKHGMLATGQYNQSDLPIGNKQLFVEGKNDCDKQLVMQVGMYLVEMMRPPVDGVTQQTDPIKRDDFIAVAKGVENRIAQVAGIPPRDVMDGNPSTISWRSVVWPVRLHNGAILQVKGPGSGKWGSEWRAVASGNPGIVSWNGIGTGRGPVIVYQRTNNVWTLVLVDYATGALKNIHHFNQRVTPMSGGEYGATVRSGDKCYDYSWDHLKEISCKSKNFIFGGPQSITSGNKKKDDPIIKDPDVTVTGYKTPGTGQTKTGGPPHKDKKEPDKKSSIMIPSGGSSSDYYRESEFNFYVDGVKSNPPWVFEYDDTVEIKILETLWVADPSDPYASILYDKSFWRTPIFETNGFGEFVNGKYDASVEGENFIHLLPDTMVNTVDRHGTVTKRKGPWGPSEYELKVHVNPRMVPADYWPSDKDTAVVFIQLLDSEGYTLYTSSNPIRISLQGPNTSPVEKIADYDNCAVFYVRDFTENGKICPPAIYTIYVYQQGKPEGGGVGIGDIENDLHTVTEYKIALPVKQGSCWKKDILVTTTWKKFKKGE